MPKDSDFLETAKARFKLAKEADHDQTQRELEDLRIYAGEVWSREALTARGAQPASGNLPPVPARPSLSIPLISEPVRLILNLEREAELNIELVAADDFGQGVSPMESDEIELREGLARRIQRESEAADARTWAFTRAVIAGRGYYAVRTRYLPGKTWDQEVYIDGFYDQQSVTLDPAHEQPDASDCRWGFVTNDYVPLSEYQQQYRKNAKNERNPIAAATNDEFQGYVDGDPDWFRVEGEVRYVRLSDYYYVDTEPRGLALLRDGTVVWEDEIDDRGQIVDSREVLERTMHWCKLDGLQVLERTELLSSEFPIIKLLGEAISPYDRERRAQGMVRPGRDSLLGFNAILSKGVEVVGFAPIAPFQAAEGQIEGYEAAYQLANTRPVPVLFYRTKDLQGNVVGPPTRVNVDTPIAAIATFMQVFRDTLQSTTGIHDPQLGQVDPALKSGRAIAFLQRQSQHGTSGFLDNYKRALRREGKIINSYLEPVYGRRPGRLVRLISKHGEPQTAAINGQPPRPMNGNGKAPKVYKLTKDVACDVVVKVTQALDTRRQEETKFLGEMLAGNPQLLAVFGDLFFRHSDMPGHLELEERAKIMLDPRIQQALAQQAHGNGGLPPQAQMMLQQLQQRVQEAEKVMQAQAQELATRQAETQAKVAIAQMGMDKDIRLQEMRDATALAVAKINIMAKGIISDNEADVERLALASENARTASQQAHEARMAGHEQGREHAHDVATTALEHSHELERMQLEQDHVLEQQQQAAELAPEPAAEGESESTE